MASVLTIGAVLVLLSMLSCFMVKRANHEIQGSIHLLIMKVFFVGGSFVDRLLKRSNIRKDGKE